MIIELSPEEINDIRTLMVIGAGKINIMTQSNYMTESERQAMENISKRANHLIKKVGSPALFRNVESDLY